MNERLKKLRKHLGLTQQEISSKIGIKQHTYSQYETGRNEPIDAVISLICREFNVNEKWLRTGEGEMFVKKTEDEEAEYYRNRIDELFTERDEKFRRALLEVILRMDARQVAAVKEYAVRYLLPAVEGEAAGAIEADDGEAFAEESGPAAAGQESQPKHAGGAFAIEGTAAADPGETLPEGSGLSEGPAQPAADGRPMDGSEPLSVKEEIEIAKKVEDYRRQLRIEKRAGARSSALSGGEEKKEA